MRNNFFFSGLIIVCGAVLLCLMPSKAAYSEVEHGKTGLIFTAQGLDDIGVGKVNGGIGLKAWMTDNAAVRASFGIGLSNVTQKATSEHHTDQKEKEREISFGGGVEFHPLADKRASPYLGAGVNFSTSTTEEEPSIHETNPYPGTTKLRKWTSNSFRADALVGVEFFVSSRLSLSGEYQMGFFSGTSKYKREVVAGQGVQQPKEEKTTTKGLGVNTSSLILTVYF